MSLALSTPTVALPVGTDEAGATVEIPIRRHGRALPTVLTGGLAVGKTALLEHLARHVPEGFRVRAYWYEDSIGRVLSPAEVDLSAEVLLLDEADRLCATQPQEWCDRLRQFLDRGGAVIAVTHSVRAHAFGDHHRLRDLLLQGNVVRFWTGDHTERCFESRVDLSQLSWPGQCFVQTVSADEPVLTSVPFHPRH